MKYIEVEGGYPLYGELTVQGSKNAALPMMAAALLTQQPVTLDRCPQIEDVQVMCSLLRCMGAEVCQQGDRVRIQAKRIQNAQLPDELACRMRSSIMLMGPLLSRTGQARMAFPGGCVIGKRPIDLHLQGLRQLGFETQEDKDCVQGWKGTKASGARPAEPVRCIHLSFPSVGATENLLMASVLGEGETILSGAAREPEVRELALLLQQMGAQIEGAGTDQLRIQAVKELGAAERSVIGDRIVAGTYLLAAAATAGEVLLHAVDPVDNRALFYVLEQMGCQIQYHHQERWVHLRAPKALQAANVATAPHPGFPTDLQAMMMVAMTQAEGVSRIEERIFENRFRHVEALRRMGARISVQGRQAVVCGKTTLKANELWATDLRAGAAMVIGGLCTSGVSQVYGLHHVQRGYEKLEQELLALGAHIQLKEKI